LSNTEDLFTRFEGLFREYLQRPLIVGFGLTVSLRLEPTKRDLLRQFFDLSWDKKELPSKKLLMEVVRFIGPPPIRGFKDVEDHVAESFDLALEKLRFEEPKQDTKKGKECIAKFPSPPGLRWEDTTIAFISDNEIKVEAKGLAEQYSYDEIELDDQRSGGKRKLWFVLRGLAMLEGRATKDDLAHAAKGQNKAPKDIQLLREILYKLMGIKSDPFYDTKKSGYYQTKFTLRDEQMGVLRKD